jgi:hypothetical protein
MSDRITPAKSPKGRAATKAHHRKPSREVAIRAFASKAGRGKALLEYAAERIKSGALLSIDDLQRAVDSGDFGRWLNARANSKVVIERRIVAEGINPNWKPAPAAPKARSDSEIGDEYRDAVNSSKSLREKFAVERDREDALDFCFKNNCPGDFDSVLARVTSARHISEILKGRR